jgi:hypothetical protein
VDGVTDALDLPGRTTALARHWVTKPDRGTRIETGATTSVLPLGASTAAGPTRLATATIRAIGLRLALALLALLAEAALLALLLFSFLCRDIREPILHAQHPDEAKAGQRSRDPAARWHDAQRTDEAIEAIGIHDVAPSG